jgi:hypothetical protein
MLDWSRLSAVVPGAIGSHPLGLTIRRGLAALPDPPEKMGDLLHDVYSGRGTAGPSLFP